MYDPYEVNPYDDEESATVGQATGAAKPGKYGANEGDVSRFASMASKDPGKKLPPSKTIGMTASYGNPEGSHGLPAIDGKDSAQAEFGPENPGSLADHHAAQAELYKPDLGNLPKEASDAPSETIAQAQGTGKYGDKGASAGDIMSILGGGMG